MNVLKKTFAVAAAVSLVCLSSTVAMAANKLIVKDTTGDKNMFTVTDSGFIGIGENVSPNTALQVVGTDYASARIKITYSGTTSSNSGSFIFLRQDPTGTNSMPIGGDKLGTIIFGAMNGSSLIPSSAINSYASSNWSDTSTRSCLTFSTITSGTYMTERMRIHTNGYVGIGTGSPTQKLDVYGGVRINTTGTRPDCTESLRGTFWVTHLGTDIVSVCVRSSGVYGWHDIPLNP